MYMCVRACVCVCVRVRHMSSSAHNTHIEFQGICNCQSLQEFYANYAALDRELPDCLYSLPELRVCSRLCRALRIGV
jgi:hypothetical protein